MFEDVNFAKLVQQQVVSCIAAFITSERDLQWGAREEQSESDGSTTTLEELTPGLVHRLRPGESLESFSPNVPSPEFMHHVRLIVRLIGGCIGMPLELVMLDTTDTTFHGYRGVLQQARKGFERRQQLIVSCFHRPVVTHLLQQWALEDPALRRNKNLLRHSWTAPGFPYVDPKVDAQADQIRMRSCLASPRRIHAEQGASWDDVQVEIVDDMGSAIEKALTKAKELNDKFPDEDNPVTWREVLNLDNPAGNTRTVREQVGEAVADGVQEGARAAQEKK
jgi:capsid protein